MVDDPRVPRLIEEVMDSDRAPEDVCRACPELLPAVLQGLARLRMFEADVAAMFPANGPKPRSAGAPPLEAQLPVIPGYTVLGVLGRGGMGVVYKARHLKLARNVAVKMLLTGDYAGPSELARFMREAQAIAALRHPHIIQVYDMGDLNGRPFFTMEYVEGGSLAQKLAGVPQPGRDTAAMVATLAEAVQFAHTNGIIHRDLKPANILLTADGTPKISDFGLARSSIEGPDLTVGGVRLGTPSYMSPEQAIGRQGTIGPSTDIYSLGAVLYEMLTGRPPFRLETPAQTERQVIEEEPAAPSRLNSKIPRDLETICLKCLQKAASRRYRTARDLADDLRRFLNHEPIQARPIGPIERAMRWMRRKPTAAALVVTALTLIALAIGGGVRLVQQQAERRAELRTEVGTAVTQAASFRKGFHFQEARALLEQARQRMEPTGPDDLRRQVDLAWSDLELAENLDAARLRAASPVEGRFDIAGAESLYAESLYEEILAKAGLGGPGDDTEVAAARARDSTLRAELVAALDDWASITPDKARRARLLAVARGADPDPLRDRLRQPELWDDGPELTKLVQELRVAELSPQLTSALGRVLLKTGGDAVPLLSAAHARDPQDFWLNFELGWALFASRRFDEALGFYRSALSLRPEASSAHHGVGVTLNALGRWDEAIAYFEQALSIDSDFAMAHASLGLALWNKGRHDEAIRHYREAIRVDPDPKTSAWAHNSLGLALWNKDQRDEAISHYQEAIRLDPQVAATAHRNLALALWEMGREDEANHHYQESIRLNPNGAAMAHNNLALALWGKDRRDEAISHYQEAIRLDPNAAAMPHCNLGLALRDMGRLDEAISHFQESIRLDPKGSGIAHYSLGLILREKGRMNEAISHWQQAIELQSASPILSRDNFFKCLYAAACGLARESAGEGSPAEAPLGEEERAGKRRQALGWLRTALELRTKQPKEEKPVDWSFTAWQKDPALAGVREPAALAKLPDAEREQWQRFWADVAAQLAADPVEQGRAHAARGDWAEAADSYGRALSPGETDDGHLWFEYTAVLLLSGDRAGYAKACARMVERCGKAPGLRAYHVARACTLAPDAVPDASQPGRLAESELASAAGQFWSLTQQGALHYRAGRFPEAVALFEQSLAADTKPGRALVNWLWLALASERLGKSEEAHRWLGKATAWLDQFHDGMPSRADAELGLHLHNWLEAQVLRREAEGLTQPPASDRGPSASPPPREP